MKRRERGRGPLYDYLQEKGIKHYKFAERIGISKRIVSYICHGHKCGTLIGKLIENETSGRVKAEDIVKQKEK